MGRSLEPWLLIALFAASPAAAQSQGLVVRDHTLGEGKGEVVGPGTDPLGHLATYLITPELGEQRGSNLFHSFARFGIGAGETATFTGPDPIDGPQSVSNVISRVTGGSESQIYGWLRSTIPGADLWLLNPSGVVFGEGAQLHVPGSFHASTGDYLGFGEGGLERFYSDGRESSVLSTAPPVAFGFLGEAPAAAISVTGATLATVRAGDGLELAGDGVVTLTRATLNAPGGAISIRGGQIVVEEGSQVLAENAGEHPAGTITVAASESLTVDASLLSVNTSSASDAGTIQIDGGAIALRNGSGWHGPEPHAYDAGATADTTGSGAGGTIRIDAESLEVTDGAAVSVQTVGLKGVEASGAAGAITIEAGELLVATGGSIVADSWASSGDGGSTTIRVGTLTVIGNFLSYTGISAVSYDRTDALGNPEEALGNPGAIEIEAQSVEVADRGVIEAPCANCVGEKGGSIEISTGSLELRAGGYLSTQTAYGSSGNAGVIRIRADSVLIHEHGGNGTGIFVLSGGGVGQPAPPTGDAGDVWIDTGSLVIERQGVINARTWGAGAGGSVVIRADSVVITEQGVIRADTAGEGFGGTISVDARTVLIESQGIMHAGTSATGRAGTIDVTASESILVTGAGDPRFSLDRIVDAVNAGGNPEVTGIFSANGSGSITLKAPVITLTDGALVLVSTGSGDAGDVLLSGDRIYIRDGAFVDSTSYVFEGRPGGDVGNITLDATELIEVVGSRAGEEDGVPFDDPSRVTSANLSEGEGGTVELRAPHILIDGGAVATTALPSLDGSQGVSGGNITVSAGELIVRAGGRIDASSFIAGPGGSIDVTASDSILVEGAAADGTPSGIGSRTSASGPGGAVTLRAPVIELSEGGEVSAKSEADPNLAEEVGRVFDSLIDDGVWIGEPPAEATGDAGSVTLVANRLKLFGGTIATNAEAADGGDVTIEAKDLVHLDAGVITAAVRDGAGGNITIDPEVVILQNGSRIVADAGTGSGGNIQITADNYFAFPGSVVDASSDLGIDGIVEVSTPDVDLAGTLTALPASYLDAASLMKERCAARRSGERAGSFAVRGNGGIPAEPDGWLPGTVSFGASPEPVRTSAPLAAPGAAPLLGAGACR